MTSIHQPNSDVLMMFDKLYVLAKRGKCVWNGETTKLKSHLQLSQVQCEEWQIPIEQLIKVASKVNIVSY